MALTKESFGHTVFSEFTTHPPHGIGGVFVICQDVTKEHALRLALETERQEERLAG